MIHMKIDERFVNSGRPGGKTNQATIIANMRPEEREYMLYLPLYDGLVSLSIGVDSLATIVQPSRYDIGMCHSGT